MKKLFIALLLVPMINAEDVFLKCKRIDIEDPLEKYILDIQVMLDKQLVKMHQDIEFKETSNGVINWNVIIEDKDSISMAWMDFYLDRKDLSLTVITDYTSADQSLRKEDDSVKYKCVKLETQF